MTETGTNGSRRRAPRWMVAALVASLALNFIVVGLVAGATLRFRSGAWAAHGVTPNQLGYASTLPAERRRELWKGTEEDRQQIRPFRREVRAAREATLEVLMAEPFDKQRFMAAQTGQANAENRARDAVQRLYAEIADKLTAQERHDYRRWRDKLRPPGRNLLDEPDLQAREPKAR